MSWVNPRDNAPREREGLFASADAAEADERRSLAHVEERAHRPRVRVIAEPLDRFETAAIDRERALEHGLGLIDVAALDGDGEHRLIRACGAAEPVEQVLHAARGVLLALRLLRVELL